MIVIGLTGSIGMGKTTLGRQLQSMGVKLCSADAIVHKLMGKQGKAVGEIEKLFPEAVSNGAVDRKILRGLVFADDKKLKALEHVLHPLVVEEENRFVYQQQKLGARAVALDIPLLFETSGQHRCNYTVVASAPHFIQHQRVLKRSGMTEEAFMRILAKQMPDREKRRRASLVVETGLGKAYSFRKLKSFMQAIHET